MDVSLTTFQYYNSETDTEVTVDGDQRFTMIHPEIDICTEKAGPEIAQKWAETKAAIEGFVGFLRYRGSSLKPVFP